MKTPPRIVLPARRQHGTVAIECAVIIPLLLILLWSTFNIARLYWHASALRNATSAAARFAATMSPEQLAAENLHHHPLVQERLIRQLRAAGIPQAAIDRIDIQIYCIGSTNCNNGPPDRMQVEATMNVMSAYAPRWIDRPGDVTVTVEHPYIK